MAPREHPTRNGNRSRNTPGVLAGVGGGHVAVAGTALVALTAAVGLVGFALVPEEMFVHWSVGPSAGPTADGHLPRAVGLAVVPAVSALVVVVDRLLRRSVDAVRRVDPYYAAAVVGTLAALAVCQVVLVAVNALA